jgi:hypothetical protein
MKEYKFRNRSQYLTGKSKKKHFFAELVGSEVSGLHKSLIFEIVQVAVDFLPSLRSFLIA